MRVSDKHGRSWIEVRADDIDDVEGVSCLSFDPRGFGKDGNGCASGIFFESSYGAPWYECVDGIFGNIIFPCDARGTRLGKESVQSLVEVIGLDASEVGCAEWA